MVITATSPMTLYSAVMLLSSQVVSVSKKERAFYFANSRGFQTWWVALMSLKRRMSNMGNMAKATSRF
jgi:hypothetical protein